MIRTVNVKMPFFSKKIETVGTISDFLTPIPTEKPNLTLLGSALAFPILTHVNVMSAGALTERMVKAFDPLIELIQGLSYPLGFIMISAGALVVMTGQKQKGINMIKWAAVGYILTQFAPSIMRLLMEVGKAVRTGG